MDHGASHAEPGANDAPRRPLPVRAAAACVRWATCSKLRLAVAGAAGLAALAGVFALWSYVAQLAVESLSAPTVGMALAALDAGDVEEAKSIVGDMQSQVATPELIGGAMFVLGAVKAREADAEVSAERRLAMFQVAARYLMQARSQGVPAGRETEAAFLLGKSLVRGGQCEAGIPALREALALKAEPAVEVHALLAKALLESRPPNLEQALAHNEHVIGDASLSGEARDEAWLERAETLMRLGRPEDAVAAMSQAPSDGPLAARRMMLLGRLALAGAESLPADSGERKAQLDAAVEHFEQAQRLDVENGALARQAMYWTAVCFERRDDRKAARAQYNRLSNLYGDTDEGLAASLAEADYARLAGENKQAMEGYAAVLQAVGNPHTYENSLVSLTELQDRLWKAYEQYVREERFADSLAMLDICESVLGRAECTELRAKTHQQWGAQRRDAAADGGKDAERIAKEGRFHLRAAGREYEDLARIRYATRYFTRDLWAAADCYFQGQSFSNAARVFQEFLLNEARQLNDVAMVRLGQSMLALGRFDKAVAALEECIEVYPENPVTHQARLEAGRAYRQLGRLDRAEALLRANLEAQALTPQSPEWRDSRFALGHLLYESDRFEEAIEALQEAVVRYPDNEAALLAKYTIARAYHQAAAALSQQLRDPKLENEAQISRNRKLIGEYLEGAYSTYLDVQQTITLAGHDENDPLTRMLLRNCYMMQGSVLVELRRFDEARQAYQNVITLYQDDPVVLESFVQVANCWRRMDQPALARGNLESAKIVLSKLPADANFLTSTNFNRQQWELLLDAMIQW
ncbi:MAG TPA: tetratricopeptide repeat protein [Lacipirellulaceae bacterium]|nr:tetratricopeptide repeat protein [Lacipirellulaceae bacterium]